MHAPSWWHHFKIVQILKWSHSHAIPHHMLATAPSNAYRNKACERGMPAGTGAQSNTFAAGITHIAQAACVYCRAASQQNGVTPPTLPHSSLSHFHHHLSFPLLYTVPHTSHIVPISLSVTHPLSSPPSHLLFLLLCSIEPPPERGESTDRLRWCLRLCCQPSCVKTRMDTLLT